ncbi:MAG: HAMP domain-containing histidine kinase [Bacteriovoracaceae bacterium]|nr:HAMP domain-containing histidine kinase [Bacteriovoracaceae bacterium]
MKSLEQESNKLLKKYAHLQSVSNKHDQIIHWQKKKDSLEKLMVLCDGIESFPKEFLNLEGLHSYLSCHLIIHEKGNTQAACFNYIHEDGSSNTILNINDFNYLFNVIKKSKNKSFNQSQIKNLNLKLVGTFLAKEFILPKYNIILVISRNDFLVPNKEELHFFYSFSSMLLPIFNGLLYQESANRKIIHLIHCLHEYPYPMAIYHQQEIIFKNTIFKKLENYEDLKVKESFLVKDNIYAVIYEYNELAEHTSDIFHFQRVSLLGELLNTLRHELSNPLFGLGLSSKIIESEMKNQDDKELVEEIAKSVERCQLIIENFSNIYSNNNKTQMVSLQKLIDEAITLTKSETRGIERTIAYSEECGNLNLEVNQTWVIQILFNLIVNAAQALRTSQTLKPTITVKVWIDHDLYIKVSDNGPGIEKKKADYLFQPFYTTKESGTGLGLPISRNLVRRMKGDLYFDFAYTKGASFIVKLPINNNEHTYH